MKRITGVVFLFLFIVTNGYADTTVGFSCIEDTAEKSQFFPEIQASARKINQAVCDAILAPTRKSITEGFPRDEVAAFGGLVKNSVDARFGTVKLDALQKQLLYFEAILATGDRYPKAMPRFNVEKSIDPRDPKIFYYFSGNQKEQGFLTEKEEKKCEAEATLKAPCSVVLMQLDLAIFPYQRNANAFTAHDTQAKLGELSKQWDSYFEGARAQSFVDIAITTLIERSHFKTDHLVGPPERQWFVLHPNVVVENVEAGPDGENTKLALTIEWIGVNWWRDSVIGMPFGISLTSLYSDRPEVNDVGHGVSLYFDNKYMIGYANHGGKNGIFVSMDLLKLFEDKTKEAERYRENIKGLLE